MSNHPETLQRAEHNKANPYAQIRRDMLQDRDLSFEARGLLGYLLSKPNDWTIIISDLQQNCGRDKVRRVIKELIAAHYIKERTKIIDDKTKRITGYTPHLIYEVKADNPEYNPLTEKPLTESQRTGFHDTANHPLHNKDIQNKEEKKKEEPLPEQKSGGDDFNGFNPDDADMVMRKLNGYAEKDLDFAIGKMWDASKGTAPIDDEMAKAMFTDDEYLEVIASAKHQYNARINGLAKLVSELPEITPKSERDELAAHTMGLVQREKERQAKIQAKADDDAMKDLKAKRRDGIFDWLAQHAWSYDIDTFEMLPADVKKTAGARIGKVKKTICAIHATNNTECTAEHLNRFKTWYMRKFSDLGEFNLKDAGKWGEYYLEFYTESKAKTQTATVTQDRIKQMNLMNVHAPPPGE